VGQKLEANTNSENLAITACKQGDLTRFAELYDLYFERIYKFVYYRTFNKELAEDLVSKIFLKSLEAIGKFDNRRGSFSAWLYSVARNTVFDHFRTARQTSDLEAVLNLAGENSPEQGTETKLVLEKVIKFLKALSADQRDLVIMRVWDGLGFAEIAAITGKSEAGAKMAYSRIMAKLRTAIPHAMLALAACAQLTNHYY